MDDSAQNGSINLSLLNLKVPDSVDNAAKNLTDKPTSNIGQTLADAWFLVFGGISQEAEKRKLKYAYDLNEFKTVLENKISSIPPEKRIDPDLQIVGPALENAKYCVSQAEIREMFAKLIAASMNSTVSDQVHPIFADIVKQMSPRDASNLSVFSGDKEFPIAEYRVIFHNNNRNIGTNLPYVFLGNPKYQDLERQSVSISLLEKLGLIKIDFSMYVTSVDAYLPFEQTNEYEKLKKFCSGFDKCPEQPSIDESFDMLLCKRHPEIAKGVVKFTPLGVDFNNTCL